MWKFIFLCILIGQVLCQSEELKLPVKPQTQERLSEALQKLTDELQYFRTFFENRVNLFRRITIVQEYLQQVSDQVSQYDNVLVGQQNNIEGCKNIIVGSFNTIKGSNNYVFIQKYNGRANGDLLLGKWRIDIQNKNLVLINPSSAISFINEEFNRKYLRYVTKNNAGFGYGTNIGENVVILIKENQEGDNFDANKRVTYDPTSITYRVNNQFQYGFDPNPSFQTNVNNFAQQKKQISSLSSLGEIHQKISNQPFGTQTIHLDSTNHVLILNIPFPSSMTYIQPDILAVKSTEFLNEMQKSIFSSTQATRDVPQPDSFIIPGLTATPKSQPSTNLPSVQKIQGQFILNNNQNSLNHIFDKNLAVENFKQNLRSQIYSINNNDSPAQKNNQNLENFRPISFIDGPIQQTLFLSNSQQNPQINLSLLKMDKTDN